METSNACSLIQFVLLGLISFVVLSCEKKAVVGEASPSPTASATPVARPAQTVQPASIPRDAASFASQLHYPKDPAVAATESAVQFYCDVSETGAVENTYALLGTGAQFKAAVQSALDWGKFKPATVDGKPAPVYLGGTVLFLQQGGKPTIVVSLATYDRERVGKFANYVQPQLLGGLARRFQSAGINIPSAAEAEGMAEVLVKVDSKGQITDTSMVSEDPKDSQIGTGLELMVKGAQLTPAYSDGKPTEGALNVVAIFAGFL